MLGYLNKLFPLLAITTRKNTKFHSRTLNVVIFSPHKYLDEQKWKKPELILNNYSMLQCVINLSILYNKLS